MEQIKFYAQYQEESFDKPKQKDQVSPKPYMSLGELSNGYIQ